MYINIYNRTQTTRKHTHTHSILSCINIASISLNPFHLIYIPIYNLITTYTQSRLVTQTHHPTYQYRLTYTLCVTCINTHIFHRYIYIINTTHKSTPSSTQTQSRHIYSMLPSSSSPRNSNIIIPHTHTFANAHTNTFIHTIHINLLLHVYKHVYIYTLTSTHQNKNK